MYVWLENEFILSFNRYSIERMMVCVGMLCVDDMCTFHVLYIEREREKERHSTVDEKKTYTRVVTISKEKNSINIYRNRINATSFYIRVEHARSCESC